MTPPERNCRPDRIGTSGGDGRRIGHGMDRDLRTTRSEEEVGMTVDGSL